MTGFLASVVQQAARDSSIKQNQRRQYLSKSFWGDLDPLSTGWRCIGLAFKGSIEVCINGDRDFINYYNFLVQYTNSKRISLAYAFREKNVLLGKL